MPSARPVFWSAAALLGWTQVAYGPFLGVVRRLAGSPPVAPGGDPGEPVVSLVVAAYAEAAVIAEKVANALALDWPRDRLELIVAVDGGAEPGADATAALARAKGADVVLELPRGGKMAAQAAGVAAARGELLAFSDANAFWAPDALRSLVAPFADPGVGYVCGRVDFVGADGTNQEGLYWRMELWVRAQESALASVTAGNGAIYAVRRAPFLAAGELLGHDLALPHAIVRGGLRAVYAPAARATERMVPTVEGEWARKRRMMANAWPIVLRGGLLSPRGVPAAYAGMLFSHRALRYATPFLHVGLALATLRLLRRGRVYRLAATAQGTLLAGAVAGGRWRQRPLLVARYYVLTTASIAAGLWDHLRHGRTVGWEPPEGTR